MFDFRHLPDFAYPNDEGFKLHAADTRMVKEAVYNIRYLAYTREGVEVEAEGELFFDTFDEAPNCFSFLLTQHDEPVGSIRANHRVNPNQNVASLLAYRDEIAATIGTDSFVESNRFVIHPDYDNRSRKPLLQLMRGVAIHLQLTQAKYVVTAVREGHAVFYERLLKMHPISAPKKFPGLSVEMVLLVGDMRRDSQRVFQKLPELNPSACDIERYAAQVGFSQSRCA